MDEHKNDQTEQLQQESNLEAQLELEACRSEVARIKERSTYLQAEFDNYKKRLEKERLSWMETAQDIAIIDLLPVVDDMDRALDQVQTLPQELKVHLAGFEMIAKSLNKILKKYDVEEISYAKTFDPEYFEAVMQAPATQTLLSGEIAAILQKGYIRKGRVLRPAKVSVAV